MQKLLNRIVKISIYLLVFLVPLFFLPFTFEAFEYSKQYLLFFLVSVAFFAWVAKMVLIDKEIRFKRTPLDLFVLAFLLVGVLSAIFSVDKSSSLFGFYGRFSGGLIGLLSLGGLYFLITNNTSMNNEQRTTSKTVHRSPFTVHSFIKLFLWSAGVVILMSYFSLFGVWAKISNLISLPGVMLQRTFNPISGSLEGLAVFLAVVAVFLIGQILAKSAKRKAKSIFYWFLLAAALFLLLIIDFTAAWLVVLVSLFLFVGFSLWKRIFRENVNRLLIPIFLMIIVAACIPLQPQKVIFGEGSTITNLPKEQILNKTFSWNVGFKSAVDNVKNGLLGSGIGTFHYDFAKERPLELNQSWLWQIRFDRAGSHLAELLATLGLLGVLSYLALIGFFLLISWFLLSANSSKFQIPLLLIFVALVVGQFVYYQNITLAFMFWLILGISVISWQKPIREKIISFKDFPELSLVFSTVVIILAVTMLSMYFFGVKYYLADMNYAKAQRLVFGGERAELLEKAVRLNPNLSQYRIVLARHYLNEVLVEMARPQAQQDSVRLQNKVAQAINQARIAADLSPNQVAGWETLGMIYRDIRQVAGGATEWGIKSFEKAINLEPNNPVLYTELGKLYLVTNETEKAKEEFNKAIAKKSDYFDALIQKILILEREDDLFGAISQMENLAINYPLSAEILFQLGRLYFNNNQISQAIVQFKRVIILLPNYSNAHYSLGVAYAAQGQKNLAIEEFERVLTLNPGNVDVQKKLKELRK